MRKAQNLYCAVVFTDNLALGSRYGWSAKSRRYRQSIGRLFGAFLSCQFSNVAWPSRAANKNPASTPARGGGGWFRRATILCLFFGHPHQTAHAAATPHARIFFSRAIRGALPSATQRQQQHKQNHVPVAPTGLVLGDGMADCHRLRSEVAERTNSPKWA